MNYENRELFTVRELMENIFFAFYTVFDEKEKREYRTSCIIVKDDDNNEKIVKTAHSKPEVEGNQEDKRLQIDKELGDMQMAFIFLVLSKIQYKENNPDEIDDDAKISKMKLEASFDIFKQYQDIKSDKIQREVELSRNNNGGLLTKKEAESDRRKVINIAKKEKDGVTSHQVLKIENNEYFDLETNTPLNKEDFKDVKPLYLYFIDDTARRIKVGGIPDKKDIDSALLRFQIETNAEVNKISRSDAITKSRQAEIKGK